MDAAKRTSSGHKSSPWAFGSGELKGYGEVRVLFLWGRVPIQALELFDEHWCRGGGGGRGWMHFLLRFKAGFQLVWMAIYWCATNRRWTLASHLPLLSISVMHNCVFSNLGDADAFKSIIIIIIIIIRVFVSFCLPFYMGTFHATLPPFWGKTLIGA